MKTKILCYSSRDFNQVVTHHVELDKVNDDVYTYLFKKDAYREEDDLLAVVLRIDNVYFQEGTYTRRFLNGKDLTKMGSDFVANFHNMIEDTMKKELHLSIMHVRIYEELGRDIAPLLQYRKDREQKIEQRKQEQTHQKKLADQQAAILEQKRLQTEKNKFIAGEYIDTGDFIALCKQEGIDIPLRTHGTLNRSVLEISHGTGIRFRKQKGKRPPKLDGCFQLARALKQKLG